MNKQRGAFSPFVVGNGDAPEIAKIKKRINYIVEKELVLQDFKDQLDKEALAILLEASDKFPDSFDTWKALASLTNATPAQVADANAQMKRLDPLNPNLK
jgi:hypothetical protein